MTGVLLFGALMVSVARSLSSRVHRRRVLGRLPHRSGRSVVRAPRRLVVRIDAADLAIGPDQFLTVWLASTGLTAASVGVLGEVGLILLAGAATGPPVVLAFMRGRRDQRRRAELATFADATASAVRGGASLSAALGASDASVSGPLAVELAELSRRIDQGVPIVEVFSTWATDPDDDVRLTGRAISMVAEHGGRTGDALERTATVLRSRTDLRDERTSMAAQARSSAHVLAVAPLAFMAVSGLADPRTLHFLVATPVGVACLVTGVGLDLLGARWMATTVKQAA